MGGEAGRYAGRPRSRSGPGRAGKNADAAVQKLLARASAHPPRASPDEVADAAAKLPAAAARQMVTSLVRLVQKLVVDVEGGRAELVELIGADAEKPKKKSRSAAPTITVDEIVDDDDAPAPASEGAIFAKYGIDSSGRAPTTAAVPEPEPPFTPLKDVPDDVQVAAEKILLGGGLLCLAVFVFIGGAITVDAFSVASGSPLEPGMKAFIVDVLEPKFTPTLIAGFACSISLGGLKALQLTSDDAQYSEGVQYSEEDD